MEVGRQRARGILLWFTQMHRRRPRRDSIALGRDRPVAVFRFLRKKTLGHEWPDHLEDPLQRFFCALACDGVGMGMHARPVEWILEHIALYALTEADERLNEIGGVGAHRVAGGTCFYKLRSVIERRALGAFHQAQMIGPTVDIEVEIACARERCRRGEDRMIARQAGQVRDEPAALQIVFVVSGDGAEGDPEALPLAGIGQIQHARHTDGERDEVFRLVRARGNTEATKFLAVLGKRSLARQGRVEAPVLVVPVPAASCEQDETHVQRMRAPWHMAPHHAFKVHERA